MSCLSVTCEKNGQTVKSHRKELWTGTITWQSNIQHEHGIYAYLWSRCQKKRPKSWPTKGVPNTLVNSSIAKIRPWNLLENYKWIKRKPAIIIYKDSSIYRHEIDEIHRSLIIHWKFNALMHVLIESFSTPKTEIDDWCHGFKYFDVEIHENKCYSIEYALVYTEQTKIVECVKRQSRPREIELLKIKDELDISISNSKQQLVQLVR